jgi:hypothetical protein
MILFAFATPSSVSFHFIGMLTLLNLNNFTSCADERKRKRLLSKAERLNDSNSYIIRYSTGEKRRREERRKERKTGIVYSTTNKTMK